LKRSPVLFLLVLLGVATAAAAGEGPSSGPPSGRRAVEGGIALELAVEPVSPGGGTAAEPREGDAVVRFRLSDAATGTPLAGAYPAAWMDRLGAEKATDARRCAEKVQELLNGNLFNRPAVDLNVYFVLVLNQDATLSVVDPLFGYGGTQLLAMVSLDSPGEDWALAADRTRLFVSMPDSNRVAVVDTASWKKVASLEVGPRPGRVALQPDGAYLWVALDGPDGAGVAVVDTRSLTVAARIPTGLGPHDLALSDDSRFAFVTNRAAGTVSVIDVAKLAKVRDAETGPAPASVAFSTQARAAYVTSEEGGTITAVSAPGEGAGQGTRIAAEPGLGAIRFAPGGRLGFVLNPQRNKLYVLDSASNRIVQKADIEGGPDQVTFSGELAYLRQRRSDSVLMVPLKEIGKEGQPVPVVDFTGGQNPLGKVSRPSPADSIVRAPGATAVLVANPADGAIYYYKEGMAAPIGSFTNYGREPRALLVVDRSLKERQPGSYETVARLQPGRYRVALFLDSPRTVHCFDLSVAEDPVLAAQRLREQPVRVEPRIPSRELTAGQTARLDFRLTNPVTGKPEEGLTDVNVLVYLASGTWHQRQWAHGLGDGLYEVDFVPPASGTYNVAVESLSQRLPFHRSPRVFLRVVERSATSP
jgi:DNA-binding beta-propeller fold protein YncE